MTAQERLHKARMLAAEGRFSEALTEYEWFHHNALAEDPALRGVRRSFALAYWVELGEQYPPALESLVTIRDHNCEALLGGMRDRSLFADVAAINHYLGDKRSTYELFRSIDVSSSEFADECFESAIASVVGMQDFQLARKHIPNPDVALSAILDDFNDSVGRALELRDKKRQAIRLRAYVHNFVSDLRLLLAVTHNTDGPDVAEGLRHAALSGISAEVLRKRVRRALAA